MAACGSSLTLSLPQWGLCPPLFPEALNVPPVCVRPACLPERRGWCPSLRGVSARVVDSVYALAGRDDLYQTDFAAAVFRRGLNRPPASLVSG